ncbi:unnamed protein product, partial [Sphagnum jensenii]
MDVLRGLRGGDPYQEFRKGEGLQGLQASVRAAAAAGGGGGGFRATAASVPDVASSLHGSPLVPSMSGGYSFQKSSDIQEQQDSRNEGTWFQQQQQQPQQQQQQHIWVHSAEGVYQAPPAAIGMLPAPQTYAPFKLTTNETMPLFPAAREGESLPAGFTPPVYKQTYTLAAAA